MDLSRAHLRNTRSMPANHIRIQVSGADAERNKSRRTHQRWRRSAFAARNGSYAAAHNKPLEAAVDRHSGKLPSETANEPARGTGGLPLGDRRAQRPVGRPCRLRRACDHQRDLATGLAGRRPGREVTEDCPAYLLVRLGQLPAHGGRAVHPERGREIIEGGHHPVRGLEEDQRAGLGGERREAGATLTGLAWQEALEAEPVAGQAGQGERGGHRARAGRGAHRDTGVEGGAYQPEPGVGDAGHATVGHHSDHLPGAERVDQFGRTPLLVALEVGDHPAADRDAQVVREPGEVRRVIGYVPQLLSADGSLTGYENLLIFAKLYDIPRAERETDAGTVHGFWEMLADKRIWIFIIPDFSIVIGLYGLGLWMPQMIKGLGFSNSETGLLTALPYLVAIIGMVLVGRSSDKSGERVLHVAGSAALAALGFVGAAFFKTPLLVMLSFSLASLGIYAALAVFWTLPTAILRGMAAAGGLALLNSFSNLGGFFGPYLMGWLKELTGDYSLGLLVLAGMEFLACISVILIGRAFFRNAA